MKKIFLLTILLFLSNFIIAQNIENEKEPNKTDLSIKEKSFGYKYMINDIKTSKTNFEQRLKTNSEAFNLYKKGKNKQLLSTIVIMPSAAVLGWNLGTIVGGRNKVNTPALVTSGALFAGCTVLSIIGKSNIKKGLKKYNDKDNKISLNLNLNSYGLGIAAQF